MEFEFDDPKSQSNLAKHGINFVEAQQLWVDPDRIEIPARTEDEPRFLVIWQSLDLLDQDFDTVQEFIKFDKECVEALIRLDESCSDALVVAARNLLKRADDEQYEYKLQSVLRALISRQQSEAFVIVAETLESVEAKDKETYLTYLRELKDPHAVAELTKFIGKYWDTDEIAPDVAIAIDILCTY